MNPIYAMFVAGAGMRKIVNIVIHPGDSKPLSDEIAKAKDGGPPPKKPQADKPALSK